MLVLYNRVSLKNNFLISQNKNRIQRIPTKQLTPFIKTLWISESLRLPSYSGAAP